ncbi:MAG: DUF4236 domain-containing protein [Nitrosomonadales bacterium]|nr:DUF4236 domain-containing protein [Nitrosomonadales bacterium]
MGFLFRKRIKLLPGVWLNLSKGGVSTSIGGKGLTVNIKSGKTKTTVGIPGTGLNYSETSAAAHQVHKTPIPARAGIPTLVWLLILVVAMVLLLK